MNHERLKCYQMLKQVVGKITSYSSCWPRGNGELQDQLKRAQISACLNLCDLIIQVLCSLPENLLQTSCLSRRDVCSWIQGAEL